MLVGGSEIFGIETVLRTVSSDEGLTLETSATHHIPQARNIPYQPLLIKPVYRWFIIIIILIIIIVVIIIIAIIMTMIMIMIIIYKYF